MRLVLIDRDGTLNEDRPDFVAKPADLVLLPGAAAALARLNRAGLPVALLTNQSAVGRGLLSEDALAAIHCRLADALAAAGAHIDLLLVAPDAPEGAGDPSYPVTGRHRGAAGRRKPGPAMLIEALDHFRVRAQDAVMVGDDWRDLAAAVAAGCARILVRTGKGAALEARGLPDQVRPVAVCDDLAAAVDLILGRC